MDRDRDPAQYLRSGDASKPWLFASLHETPTSAWDNPDNHHTIVLDVVPPACRYWGFVLSDCWGGSFDCRCWQVHANQRRALRRADGSVRLVASHRDPRLPEVGWLDSAGHGEGVWTLRWLEADGHPLPEVRVVRFADLAAC